MATSRAEGETVNYTDNLCGVRCAYLAGSIISERDRIALPSLIDRFPNVHIEGTTLAQLQDYFTDCGLSTWATNLSYEEILESGNVAIQWMARRKKNGQDEPLGHFILLEPLKDRSSMLIMNPPYQPHLLLKEEFDVSKVPIIMISSDSLWLLRMAKYWFWLLLLILLGSFSFLCRRKTSTSSPKAMTLLALCWMALALTNCSKTHTNKTETPVLESALRSRSLGNIYSKDAESAVNTSFNIRNTGTSPLIIEKIETSCSCAGVDVANLIKPGESADLKVLILPGGKPPGAYSVKVVALTNDPSNRTIEFSVQFEVCPPVIITPSFLAIKSSVDKTHHPVSFEVEMVDSLVLTNYDEFKSVSIHGLPSGVAVKNLESRIDNLRKSSRIDYKLITITLDLICPSDLGAGSYAGTIQFGTGKMPTSTGFYRIPMGLSHDKPLRFSRPNFHFGIVTDNELPQPQRGSFFWSDKKISSAEYTIEASDNAFKVDILEAGAGFIDFQLNYEKMEQRPKGGTESVVFAKLSGVVVDSATVTLLSQ